ncbi:cadherin-like beta sandwich domain-containing protein [Turicibacter sanguinis]|uniref:cadherin-like beta sandwich domain-containing protein n=1 Tax=Turicibacter sanguinis TaxID=154288 RepID=UPI0018AA07D7|nr:cadherin-like beta sandwich domain-containing protein [Turicibacter sanguinis]MDB8558238.1 cadherin-like beta sandwich domain-containing protein [Turicibacter sanguinis]MDB8561014.1 cadherin-like beta sandwich domain-containing protein [Turicibacter sanguinis]
MFNKKMMMLSLGAIVASAMTFNAQMGVFASKVEESYVKSTVMDTKEMYPLFVSFFVQGKSVVISVDKGTLPVGTKIMYNIESNANAWNEYTGAVELNYGQTTVFVKAVYPDGTESEVRFETVTIEAPESIYPAYISPILTAYDLTAGIRFEEPLPEGTKVMYQLDGNGWTEYSEPFYVGYGLHSVGIKAIYPDGFESHVITYPVEFVETIYPSFVRLYTRQNDEFLTIHTFDELPEGSKLIYSLNDGEWQDYTSEGVYVGYNKYELQVQVVYPNGEMTAIHWFEGELEMPKDPTNPTYPTLIYPTMNIYPNEIHLTFTYEPLPEGTTVMYRLNDADWAVYEGPFYVPSGMYHLQVQAIYPDGSTSDIRYLGGMMPEPTPELPEDEVVAEPGQIEDVIINTGNMAIEFNPNVYDYNLEVEDETSEVTLDFKLPEGSEVQVMMINGKEVEAVFPLKLNLLEGETVVEITVKSNARNIHTYTFVFNKKATEPSTPPVIDTEKPKPQEPDTNKPTPEEPNENKPSTEQPNENKPTTEEPTTDNKNQTSSSTTTNHPTTGLGGMAGILTGLGLIGAGVATNRRKK